MHVILRGGTKGTNFDAASVQEATAKLAAARKDSLPSIMVDCSQSVPSPPSFPPSFPRSLPNARD